MGYIFSLYYFLKKQNKLKNKTNRNMADLPQGSPIGGGWKRPHRPVPVSLPPKQDKFDCSFQCYTCELFFDKDPKNKTESNETTESFEDEIIESSQLSPIVENESGDEDICQNYTNDKFQDDEFDKCLSKFNDVLAEDLEKEEREEKFKNLINTWKWFYLTNQKSDIISLKKTVYNKYKNVKDFTGYRFTDYFKGCNVVILLTQCVNESEEMKKIAKILFYRELHLGNYSNKHSVFSSTLFKKYIGGDERLFIENADRYGRPSSPQVDRVPSGKHSSYKRKT